jgi:predicted DNA-binding protein YlxM (UPF0122 family)
MYYAEDLSLAEIADGRGVSRQAVHDALKKSVAALEDCENKLELVAKHELDEKTMERVGAAMDKLSKERASDEELTGRLRNIRAMIGSLEV